ncbi:MAG: type II secretion system F family protein [Planctomycetaceae bacterium]|nr:type II secretion system F family protein [Planctomycetaceae bacterium]
MFNHIALKTLAVLCKSLATMLHAGVPLLKALDTLSRKTGDERCRRHLGDVRQAVEQGVDIAAAMRDCRGYFPDLMIDMVHVGEQSGTFPEVLDGLADHYENNVRLRQTLRTMIAWPAIQLFAAILIVGGLIWFLGIIGGAGAGGKPVDILGLGLVGTSGAVKWFAMSLGSIFAVLGGYYIISRVFRQHRFLDSLLMRIPVVGNCMRSFAIARFSWAFSLTQQTGMPITRSLDSSFRATGNGAFAGSSQDVQQRVMAGDELGTALTDTNLFPEDYLQMVEVAEASGTVPETLKRLSPQFEDQARRSLSALAAALGWAVWMAVAGLIIYIVFNFFSGYAKMIFDAGNGKFPGD